jgi:protein-export membrane protein SecD
MYLPQGTILHNRYVIESLLGHGGFGITYAAHDQWSPVPTTGRTPSQPGPLHRKKTSISVTVLIISVVMLVLAGSGAASYAGNTPTGKTRIVLEMDGDAVKQYVMGGPGGAKPQDKATIEQRLLNQSLEVMRNRLNEFGIPNPSILNLWRGASLVAQDNDKIFLEIPTIPGKDLERVVSLLGQRGHLEFKLVEDQGQTNLPELIEAALKEGKLKPGYTQKQLNQALADKIPADDEVYFEKNFDRESGRILIRPVLLKKKVLLTGAAIKDATVRIGDDNKPYVSVEFNSQGTAEFAKITGENVKRRLAIILDGVVSSAPVIQERISGGRAQITGSFTQPEAHDLAIVLRTSELPVNFKVIACVTPPTK